MADAQRTIDLIFNGVDRTAAATQGVLNNLGTFSSRVESATQPIANFTVGALKLEAGILAAGAALTLFAVNEAAKFESALFDLAKVLGEADGSIEEFAEAANDISAQYGVAATDVLAATANFKQAGFTGAEALQLVRNALDLKIAGDIEAAKASDLLVASIKGFGLEAKSAGQIVDLLNEVSNRYATNVNELATGFALLSPVAKAAGFSLEETAGILTPGIEVFRSGSEVANGLRTVLLRLQSDSGPVQEALAALGVTQRDANGELRTSRDIYFDVAKAWDGLTDSQKTYLAAQIAGIDQSAKFIAIMDGIRTTAAITGKDFNYLGSAAKEVEVRMRSAEAAVAQANVAFKALSVTIGIALIDEFKGVTNAVTEIFKALRKSAESDSGLGELLRYVESIAGDIEAAFKQVAKNLPAALAAADLSGFKMGIDAVLTSVKALFSGVDLTSTQGLTKAIEFLGAAFLGLSNYAAGVIESFKPMFDLLVRVGSGAATLDSDIFRLAGNIGGVVTQINLLAGALNSIVPTFETLLQVMIARQGIGLVGALAAMTTTSGLLSTALGTAGLAGVLGAAAYAAGQYAAEVMNARNASEAAKYSVEGLGSGVDGVEGAVKKVVRGSFVDYVDAMGNVIATTVASKEAFDQYVRDSDRAGGATGKLAAGLDGVAGAVGKVSTGPVTEYIDAMGNVIRRTVESREALDKWNSAVLASGGVMEEAAHRTGKLGEGVKTTGLMIDKATGAILGYYGAFEDLTQAEQEALLDQKAYGIQLGINAQTFADSAENIKAAQTATKKWNEELDRMNHVEKLKMIEAQTAILTTRMETDAAKAQAAFESISVAIESTGATMSEMLGLLGNNKLSIQDWSTLNKEIGKESTRRDEVLKLQKELTKEQIEMVRSQRKALENGDGMITIQGDGLQPHLEAFMWEILKAIQVRVNADGGAMLLGLPPCCPVEP